MPKTFPNVFGIGRLIAHWRHHPPSLAVANVVPPGEPGRLTAIEDSVTVEQRRALASRYLGPEGADAYIASAPGATERMVRILMRPEHWLTRDYTKAGG